LQIVEQEGDGLERHDPSYESNPMLCDSTSHKFDMRV
jgi:hypothetical protein